MPDAMTVRTIAISMLVALAVAFPAAAQDFGKVEVKVVPVAGSVSMLVGEGGNIGVSAGEDGVLLVDDQYAPLTEKIRAAVATIHEGPIRFVLNTHWHQDHTGGNENLGKAGSLILAHANVRRRMSAGQRIEAFGRDVPPAPAEALPVVTFEDAITLHVNGDEIHAFHVDPAHTDGDAIVHFRKSNVLHFGDTFFNGMYPFIDASSGGSADGMIEAVDRALGLAKPDTKIIPGHGPLATREDLERYRDMLATVVGRVRDLAAEGKTLEEIVAAKPTKDFDERFGGGFLDGDRFVRILHATLGR